MSELLKHPTANRVRIRPSLTIHCRECEREGNKALRAGRIENGEYVHEVTHHGRTHVIRLDLEWLKRLLAA